MSIYTLPYTKITFETHLYHLGSGEVLVKTYLSGKRKKLPPHPKCLQTICKCEKPDKQDSNIEDDVKDSVMEEFGQINLIWGGIY